MSEPNAEASPLALVPAINPNAAPDEGALDRLKLEARARREQACAEEYNREHSALIERLSKQHGCTIEHGVELFAARIQPTVRITAR